MAIVVIQGQREQKHQPFLIIMSLKLTVRQNETGCAVQWSRITCDMLWGHVSLASASRAAGPVFKSHLWREFPVLSQTSDLKIGTPVAALPGAWRYRVSTGTDRPGVSVLWLGEVESLICSFYLCVAGHTIVWADPSLRYTSMLLGR